MANTSFSIKYRPVKIGFLIREGEVDDLVSVAGINTLLWGGVYNPVIPVAEASLEATRKLINLFDVDILVPIVHTESIDAILKEYEHLRDPSHYSKNVFYEDWRSKKQVIGYLDVINIVNYYWKNEFKDKPQDFKSNCALVEWDKDDELSKLFSISFGYFPTEHNLKEDFQRAFVYGLRSNVAKIKKGAKLIGKISNYADPLSATSFKLEVYGEGVDGIFIGSINSFSDLLYFWNLRASGRRVDFLPIEGAERYSSYIKELLKHLDKRPDRHPGYEDGILIYHSGAQDQAEELMKSFKTKKHFVYSERFDDLYDYGKSEFYFDWQRGSGAVEKSYGSYNVNLALPEKEFLAKGELPIDRNHRAQRMAVSIDPISEFEYPGHTLRLPYKKELNTFFSREVTLDPWELRVQRDGFALLIDTEDSSVNLRPIAHELIIERLFKLAGFASNLSQPGLLTKLIINSMGKFDPLEGGRVFKITGVRKLIESRDAKSKKGLTWSQATKIIWDNNFSKFEELYIESRESKKLTTAATFNYLIKKRIFTAKASRFARILRLRQEFKCPNCGLKEKILVADFERELRCSFCNIENHMPSQVLSSFQSKSNKNIRFVRTGLFKKDNHQEGALPVILSLLTLSRVFDSHRFPYTTSLHLKSNFNCEIDFCVLQYKGNRGIQIGIAECKSDGQKITSQDVSNLKRVQDELIKHGLDCYIIFSKTTDEYSDDEKRLFKDLHNEKRKFIVLSNPELEPYHPFWERKDEDDLPEKYPHGMGDLYRNSIFLYVDTKDIPNDDRE